MPFINSDIPIFNAFLDTGFLYNKPLRETGGFIPVEVFGFTSLNRRCGLFSAMSEMGTIHTRVPIHYLSSRDTDLTDFPLDWLQLWDSFSPYLSCHKYEYLKNSACKVLLKNRVWHNAKYLFTLDWAQGESFQTGQSENAGGHKQGHVLVGEGGQYFIQPGNRIVWRDGGAWIGKELKGHEKWQAFPKEFSCEGSGSRWFAGEEELYFYQFEKNND
jgi:hypothetical protein